MEKRELKKSGILRIALAVLLFSLACTMQALDNYINASEAKILLGLTAQYLFFGMMAYWTVSLVSRISVRSIRRGLTLTAAMMGLILFIRLLKYYIFHGETIMRYLWYSYYIPQCIMPVLLLLTALLGSQKGEKPLAKSWYLMFLPAAFFILLVFTNDLHQWVFSFPQGLAHANRIYRWEAGYYAILAWIAGTGLAAGVLLYVKCRVSHCRRQAWIPFVLFLFCCLVCILREVFDPIFLRMPETVAFSVLLVCESLIRIGFIPSNKDHARFFDEAEISASIADRSLYTVLRSKNAPELTREQAKEAATTGKTLFDADTVLRAKPIRGGEVFWTEDLSVIHKVNAELAQTNGTLSEEGDLIAAENKLREQRTRIEEQNRLYDGIFTVFRPHLAKIQAIFSDTETDAARDRALRLLLVYGVYLKRRSNLAMLGKDGTVGFPELVYSVRESADALSFAGAVCSAVSEGDGVYPTGQITLLYEFFEDCIEEALPGLSACLVRLTATGGALGCRVALDGAAAVLPAGWREEELRSAGARLSAEAQDGTVYLTLSLGGKEAAV